MEFITQSIASSWQLLRQAAPFFLFGLLLSGALRLFMPPEQVARHLGAKGIGSVVKAALVGIPLPLCSCSVLPVASSLKRQGAGKGAVAAFLVSTPESGIDSIAISWALLDPIMTIARPIAAFFSAFVSGISQNLVPESTGRQEPARPVCSCACSCSVEQPVSCCGTDTGSKEERPWLRFTRAVAEIWDDLAGYFFAGLLVAGIISGLVPDEFFSSHLGGGMPSMLLMLLVGIPVYICATASTPVAAAMVLKGMSPGTALVFLMVGPATNITSMAVLLRILGRAGTAVYLVSIAVCAILCGLILDWLYGLWGVEPTAVIGKAAEMVPGPVMTISAILLLASFLYLRASRLLDRRA